MTRADASRVAEPGGAQGLPGARRRHARSVHRLALGAAIVLTHLGLAADASAKTSGRAPKPVPRPDTLAVSTFDATPDAETPAPAPTGANASLVQGALAARAAQPLMQAAPSPAPRLRYGDHPSGSGADDAAPLDLFSGDLAFALLDLDNERLVARKSVDAPLIPASVAKAPTALYALDALGPDYRFETRLYVSGPVDHGVLLGDLILRGGGDPTLDSDDLAELAEALVEAGVVAVNGRFLFDTGDTPSFERIAVGQPPQAAYNPGYSGLNLNFNRVLTEWKKAATGFVFTLSARARRWSPPADVVSAEASPSGGPGFEARQLTRATGPGLSPETIEHWRIAENLLGRNGARWLPVRRPARYAAGAFREIADNLGVRLPKPEPGRADAKAVEIARVESRPLREILRGMLEHSTNVTAEAVGIAASRARGVLFNDPVDITASGQAMSRWLAERFALDGEDADFMSVDNHSGLSTTARVSARSLVKMFAKAAADPEFGEDFVALLSRERVRGSKGKPKPKATTLEKTGTIYYGRALAGYFQCDGGKRFAFAILASDLDARADFDEAFDPGAAGAPRAARLWLSRARSVERRLLEDWSRDHCR